MPGSKEDAAELGDSDLVVTPDGQEMVFFPAALQRRAPAEAEKFSVLCV